MPYTETELKLRLVNPGDRQALLNLPILQELTKGQAPVKQTLQTTYFDTPDHHLLRNRLSYRLRLAGDQWIATVKADGGFSGGLHQRQEYNVIVPEPRPSIEPFLDTPIGQRLADALGSQELLPAFGTSFDRYLLDITMPDDSCIELAVDIGEIIAGEKKQPLAELELELKEGHALALIRLGSELSKAIPLLPELDSKLHRATLLAGLGAEIGQEFAPIKSWKKSLLAQDARAPLSRMILQQIHRIIGAQHSFLADPPDPEKLHQLRISLRRLRALLSFAKPLFDAAGYGERQTALRRWGNELGPLRDLDVLIEAWNEFENHWAPRPGKPSPLLDRLAAARPELLKTALGATSSGQYTPLLLGLWVYIAEWPEEAAAPVRLGDFAGARLTKWLGSILKAGSHLDFTDSQAIHSLRIHVKKLRYTLEILSPVLGEQYRFTTGRLRKLQSNLGTLHDTRRSPVLLEQWVKASAGRLLHHDCGLLLGWQARENAYTQKECKKNWRKFKKNAKRWLDRYSLKELARAKITPPDADHTDTP